MLKENATEWRLPNFEKLRESSDQFPAIHLDCQLNLTHWVLQNVAVSLNEKGFQLESLQESDHEIFNRIYQENAEDHPWWTEVSGESFQELLRKVVVVKNQQGKFASCCVPEVVGDDWLHVSKFYSNNGAGRKVIAALQEYFAKITIFCGLKNEAGV